MYVRHLLLISVVSLVLPLQAITLSTPHNDAQSSKKDGLQTERHPNPMSLFEALAFMEELTGRTFGVTTTQWHDCSSNVFEVVGSPDVPSGSCNGKSLFKYIDWVSANAEAVFCFGYPWTECTAISLPSSIWECDSEECQNNFYSTWQDLCDAAALDPCSFLTEIIR